MVAVKDITNLNFTLKDLVDQTLQKAMTSNINMYNVTPFSTSVEDGNMTFDTVSTQCVDFNYSIDYNVDDLSYQYDRFTANSYCVLDFLNNNTLASCPSELDISENVPYAYKDGMIEELYDLSHLKLLTDFKKTSGFVSATATNETLKMADFPGDAFVIKNKMCRLNPELLAPTHSDSTQTITFAKDGEIKGVQMDRKLFNYTDV